MINKNKLFLLFKFFFFIFINTSLLAEVPLYELTANKIIYKNNNQLIIAEGNAHAKSNDGKEIFAEKITYDKKQSIITTETNSNFKDNKKNNLTADKLSYDLNLKIITADNKVIFTDKNGNKFNFTKLKYNVDLEKGTGQNLNAQMIDKSTVSSTEAEFDNKVGILIAGSKNNQTLIDKFLNLFNNSQNFYTPCENKNINDKSIKESCPDWSIETSKSIHDLEKKMVYHYGALLKIKNIPVFYSPYFSHPDPTVKRKTGFLPPVFKNFNDLGQTIKTPFFWDLGNDRDLTFSPIYYFDENSIYLTEYRQQNKDSRFYLDTSFTNGYKNLNKLSENGAAIQRTDGSRNHFFFNFLGSFNDLLFSKNDLEMNIQRVSQKNYLAVNEINTQYVKKDLIHLNNNIILNSYEDNKKISIKTNIYENLNDDNPNTKYQYIFPSINFSNFFTKNEQYINFNTSFVAQNLGTNKNQSYINNTLGTTSETKILSFLNNVSNTFKTSFNNLNYYNENISGQKEKSNSENYLTIAVENTYPLIKTNENNEQMLIPKIFTKFTTGSMNDSTSENKILTYGDIYSMNRLSTITSPETGPSIGYGLEYESKNKNLENIVYKKTNFSIGQIIKPEKNYEMPRSSTLQNTRSAFVGSANFYYNYNQGNNSEITNLNNNKLTLNYDYILGKDFNKILKNSISGDLGIGKNNFKVNYYEIREIANEHFVELGYQKEFLNNLNFETGIKRNLRYDFTETNYIGTNYNSDCLQISLKLSKQFYENAEIKPSNSLTLSFVFKPFGSSISPDIASLVK